MTLWKSFGASVRGPAHIAENLPNQDAWTSFHRSWGSGIVVSDGVGSKPFSDFGSRAACRAVVSMAKAHCDSVEIPFKIMSRSIHDNWLRYIAPIDARDCAATCLFAIYINDVVHLGMLGDGLVAVIKKDGDIRLLLEDKSQSFSNMTTTLSSNLSANDWKYFSIPGKLCSAILLCTDGVAGDLVDVKGFVTGLVESNGNLARGSASRKIRQMLENWPTPKHSDDKTIACLCSEEAKNEQA